MGFGLMNGISVVPAQAGVILVKGAFSPSNASGPRASGGDPANRGASGSDP